MGFFLCVLQILRAMLQKLRDQYNYCLYCGYKVGYLPLHLWELCFWLIKIMWEFCSLIDENEPPRVMHLLWLFKGLKFEGLFAV